MAAWARRYGLTEAIVHSRLRDGWSVEAAFTTPVGRRGVRRAMPDERQMALAIDAKRETGT